MAMYVVYLCYHNYTYNVLLDECCFVLGEYIDSYMCYIGCIHCMVSTYLRMLWYILSFLPLCVPMYIYLYTYLIYLSISIFLYLSISISIYLLLPPSLFSAAACSDPGIVFLPPKKEVDKEAQLSSLNNTMECGRCNLDRPRTATHCYECGVCVDQLDHHCPVSIDAIHC